MMNEDLIMNGHKQQFLKACHVLSHNLGLLCEETQFKIGKCYCLGQVRDGKYNPVIKEICGCTTSAHANL